MDVEIVRHKVPLGGSRITVDGPSHMVDEIGFGSGRSTRWAHDLSGDPVEVDHERQGAVARVRKLPSRHLARPRREVRRQPFKRLDMRQFIGAHRALTRLGAFSSAPIHGTDISDLGVSVDVGGRGEPRPHSMRLQVGRF